MKKLVVSPRAIADLEEIHAYIAADNLEAALRFIERLQLRFQRLAEHPGVGRKRGELLPGMRSAREGNYYIFFKQISYGIEIVRVIQTSRDINRIFQQGDF